MSKLARPLFLIPGLLSLLLVGALVAALQPSVQRWAVRRALADRPGLKLEFAHLAAGLSGAELRGVVLERPGLRVRAASVEADYVLWRFLLQNRLDVSRLAVHGLEVEVSGVSAGQAGSGVAGGSAVAPGAIVRQTLPWEIVLGRLDVTGRVLLPSPPGRPAVPGEFEIKGGDIAPGREGSIQFRLDLRDDAPGARVATLRAQGTLSVRETPVRTIDQAGLMLVIDAEGPRLTGAHQLQLSARMSSAADGARYSLNIDTRRDGLSENLVTLEANAPAQQPRFNGRWAVHAGETQVEPFFLGRVLPKFTLEGSGGFGFHTDTGAVAVDGTLRGTAAALEAIDPSLRPLGLLRWDLRFDVAADSGVVALNRLTARLEGDRPVATIELKRPLTLDARRRQVQLAAGDGEVGRVALQGLPLAWVRPFVHAADVSGGLVTGEFVVTGDARHLGIESAAPFRAGSVSIVRDGALLLDRADFSLGLAVRLAPESLSVNLRDVTLATPAGDRVRAQFQLGWPLQGESPARTLELSGSADLPGILRTYTPLAPLRFSGSAELAWSGERLEVRNFSSEVATVAGQKLLSAASRKPVVLDLRQLQLVPAGPGETELARLIFERVPLDQVFDPALLPVAGELAPGGFVVAAKGPRLFVRPVTPVRLGGLTLGRPGGRRIEDIIVQTSPTLDFGSLGDWKLSDGATVVLDRNGNDLLDLNLEASAGQDGLRAAASFNADLAALGAQPLLASLQPLGAGRASGEVRAAVAGRALQVELRSTMNGLVLREGNQVLPVANLSLRAVRGAEGKITVEAPLLLDRLGQRSNLNFTLEAVPQGALMQADLRLAGDHLELADALALAALAGGQGTDTSAPSPVGAAVRGPVKADVRPFWAGWRGSMNVDVKEIVRGHDWALRDFSVAARIDPDALRLEKLGGVINEKGRLSGQGELAFRPGAMPYALRGELALSEFDVGAFLKAFDPDKAPVLEGVFAVEAKAAGSGATLDDTLERTRGSFQLQSRAGVFRGLRRTSDKVSVATKAVDAVAALGQLFGSSKVKEAAEKVAGQTYQVDQLAQALAELPFDQCVIRATRDERLDFRIDELSVVSPEVRFSARGHISHVEGRPLAEQPLNLSYQLAARGKVEQTLGRLRALDGTRDELDYAKARNLGAITGTVARPQTFLYGEILKFAESKLGDLFN